MSSVRQRRCRDPLSRPEVPNEKLNEFGDKSKITSNSLRSLCKTVLNNTNPSTASASDRSKVVIDILTAILPGKLSGSIDMTQLNDSATPVRAEESELKKLKDVLGTQGTLRPIFEGQLRQRRSVRERALALRKLVAESGLDYKAVSEICGADDGQPEPDKVVDLKNCVCDYNRIEVKSADCTKFKTHQS